MTILFLLTHIIVNKLYPTLGLGLTLLCAPSIKDLSIMSLLPYYNINELDQAQSGHYFDKVQVMIGESIYIF